MNERIARIGSWVEHLVKARTRHSVHSPFVYKLTNEVLRVDDERPEFEAIEALREELLLSEQSLRVNDLGAGSRVLDEPVRQVSDMARTSLKPARQAQMLFRLAEYFMPETILELGTSFGLSTLYLARGAGGAQVTTIEGCPHTHRIAQHHFERLRQNNISALLGSFRSSLPFVLRTHGSLDMVFIDGHHAHDPTLEYFEACLQKAHNNSVFILDDIHWSKGMEAAWEAVKQHPRVTVTIDLYDLGLVFFRQEQAPQHFRLRY
ncbi:MAG TPA: class I SAM-dependent methyltransferase [Flavobacteriales bacterium]|jgi:predicted O-methyltransferase YrrM|nr:class I SAM-dependent methyltransferase [Flavobacteriales bacterium]MCC6656009.1 class I SAM-dependent methyltransferase [Flavobacteriales bacterium]HMU13238.1 class I SAM-dependent methyltransferase [Flavobacteriales bacterium]HNI04467.1 class I SAM-dependent methyltransferase [Flavobacteriales bacterium]HNK40546.1 class I SAM-dependent methyltransferase [Flavobacteriales bacterium]